jgi:small subunit ribosomal protein S9
MSTNVNATKVKASAVLPKEGRFYGTGRRKTASARVWIARGSGKMFINGQTMEEYLARPILRMIVNQPFVITDKVGSYDMWCTVEGSGHSGQAGAIRLGISRALDQAESEMHKVLRQGGFLTRDSREVERKKYGHKKARKRFQFSKR